MLCNHCGSEIPEGGTFCNRCGQALSPAQTMPPSPGMPYPGLPTQTSGKAIASLITGVLFFILPSAIAAIVLGHIARSEIRKSGGRLQGNGIALAGLIMGYMGVAVIPFLIIAAIAIPNLLRARTVANEASAVSSIRRIAIAELRYAQSHPAVGFTCDFNELRAANLIDARLAHGIRNGYVLNLQNCTGSTSYQLTARPAVPNQSGTRVFCSDQTALIRFDSASSEENCLKNGIPLH